MSDEPQIPPHWFHEEIMTPGEVGKVFDVDPRTVSKWAKNGLIGFFRTPSGLRRFPRCEVERLMAGRKPEDPELLVALANMDQERTNSAYVERWRRGEVNFRPRHLKTEESGE